MDENLIVEFERQADMTSHRYPQTQQQPAAKSTLSLYREKVVQGLQDMPPSEWESDTLCNSDSNGRIQRIQSNVAMHMMEMQSKRIMACQFGPIGRLERSMLSIV